MSKTGRAAARCFEAGAERSADARRARAALVVRRWVRIGGWTVLGAVGCLGVGALARPGAESGQESEVAGWVIDRDGGALVALDAERLKLARHPLESPVELALDAEGRLWVACAGPEGPVGPHRVVRIDGVSGAVEREWTCGPVLDLEAGEGAERGRGEAWMVALAGSAEREVSREVSRVPAVGPLSVVERSVDAFCVAGQRGAVLVGSERGELRLYGPQGQRLAVRNFGGLISDLAPGPQEGTWWVLDAQGSAQAHRVALLERDLRSRWERSAGIAAIYLAPVPHVERVWLSDANGSHARRFGFGGALELAHVALPHAGAARASAAPDGSLWLAAPGALLCLDGAGGVTPGQGGFDFLVDVVRREAR